MTDKGNPLVEALPPATDYLTYLTLVEYNLSVENLSTLHEVLQDEKLTTNIGWDLVHLLLPLLPDSEQCLLDIARLGNPREVVLKVTESLRAIDFETSTSEVDGEDANTVQMARLRLLEPIIGGPLRESGSPSSARDAKLPLPVVQFQALLSMLAILHPRIKAKYPSRFLSTTLQAVLASYSEADYYKDELTTAVVKFIKTLSGTKRPHLPPRKSSSRISDPFPLETASDPEAHASPPSADEAAIENRLMQSFMTHVLEEYIESLSSIHDVPGLAWASRLQEKLHPERIVPGRKTYADRFSTEEYLQTRSSIVGQIVAIMRDLGLGNDILLATVMDPSIEATGRPSEEDEPPSSAEDIPLSKTGSLYLLAARNVSDTLFGSPIKHPDIPVFPGHSTILQNFIGKEFTGGIGMESEALIDAVLAFGLLATEGNNVGEPNDDEHFVKYLQTTSLLSANTPSPTLRYHAHYLTSTILRSHPSDVVRLSFIRDTLEHCPYENLKASAVGWLKGETLEANQPPNFPPTPKPPSEPQFDKNPSPPTTSTSTSPPSIFATPVALSIISPFLFPDLTHGLAAPSLSESWAQFKLDLGFYLATLNFYWLLLEARHLHEPLDVQGLHKDSDIAESYLSPLRNSLAKYRDALARGGMLSDEEGDEGTRARLIDLAILEDVLDRVEAGVKALNGL